jgi:hypothetical protein
MPYASEDARDLAGRLLVYESGDRIRAKEVSAALCSDHWFPPTNFANDRHWNIVFSSRYRLLGSCA